MAAIAWTNVVDFAAELATVDVDAQNDILAYVNGALAVDVFGGETSAKLKLARIFLAAHFGTLSSQGGSSLAGPVISESVGIGTASRAYASTTSGDSDWGSTSYGKLYAQLLKTTSARFPRAF